MSTDAKPWETFELPTAPAELRRHVAELARAIAAHAHNVAALALESMRLSAMANQLEQAIGSPDLTLPKTFTS